MRIFSPGSAGRDQNMKKGQPAEMAAGQIQNDKGILASEKATRRLKHLAIVPFLHGLH
jgi:hypothetical protein